MHKGSKKLRHTLILYISSFVLLTNIFISVSDKNDQLETNSSPIFPSPEKILKWDYPPGYHQSTFEEYLQGHPYSKGVFESPVDILDLLSDNPSIAILVENSLYKSIKDNLKQYISDIENEGYSIFLQTLSGGSPIDVKAWIKTQYKRGCEGIVFIGDIPAIWAKVGDEVFPCDLFYMDLDGNWEDTDNDGIYDSHTAGSGDMAPEVYVARLYSSTLNYDSEVNMINNYLEKTHSYRIGKLMQPWRGLEYVDEDWYDMDVDLDEIYEDNVTRYDFGYRTTADDYLEKLQQGWQFVQVWLIAILVDITLVLNQQKQYAMPMYMYIVPVIDLQNYLLDPMME